MSEVVSDYRWKDDRQLYVLKATGSTFFVIASERGREDERVKFGNECGWEDIFAFLPEVTNLKNQSRVAD